MKLTVLLLDLLKKKFTINLLLVILLFLTLPIYAQSKLTLGDIFTGLRSKKVTIEERNRLLTDAVKSRGVTFAITEEIVKELEATGAVNALIEAIKEKSVVSKPVPAPTAVLPPVSQPVALPVQFQTEPEYLSFQRKGDGNFVKGDYDQAVLNYTRAAELNPNESSIYLSRGLVYYNRKFFDLAVKDYAKVIEINPQEKMAYYYRADSLEKLGEFEKAVADYQKLLELDETNENAKSSLHRISHLIKKSEPNNVPTSASSAENRTVAKNSFDNQKNENTKKTTNETQTIEIGSLVNWVTRLVQPIYPQSLRSRYITGEVMVRITIDEEGNPIEVKAVSGHLSLRGHSEDALKKSKFKPVVHNGQPTKATGFITFNFKPY